MIVTYRLTEHDGGSPAVEDLSFAVIPGAVTGFLGPTGAGESTALRTIVGLDAPDAGSATVNGVLDRLSQSALRFAPEAILENPVASLVPQPETFSATIGLMPMVVHTAAALCAGAAVPVSWDA